MKRAVNFVGQNRIQKLAGEGKSVAEISAIMRVDQDIIANFLPKVELTSGQKAAATRAANKAAAEAEQEAEQESEDTSEEF